VSPQVLERLQALWAYRVEQARPTALGIPAGEELAAFGWWFISGKFGDSWTVAQLIEVLRLTGRVEPTHMVIEHLATLVGSMPAQTVQCLRLIMEGDEHGWGVRAARQHVRTILAAALQSSNEEAKELAVDLIHRLGARGDLSLRDLLPQKRL
jgi:hypothetical protein